MSMSKLNDITSIDLAKLNISILNTNSLFSSSNRNVCLLWVSIAYLSVAFSINWTSRGVLYVEWEIVLNNALPDVIQAELTLPLFR